jgi:hypothetical protein
MAPRGVVEPLLQEVERQALHQHLEGPSLQHTEAP